MPKFKEYNQGQMQLLPPDIRDIIPSDHICYIINDVVDNLDITLVEETYSNGTDLGGASAISPRLLIKLLFYTYSQGIRSSRLVEKKSREDLVFRYLAGNTSPDHSTINMFRKKHLVDLEKLFASIVILCGSLNMTDFSDISIDGSIFKASASKKNTFNREEIAKWKKRMKKILREAERVDKKENKKYGKERGYDQLPPRLADPETRKAEIKRLMDKMNKLEMADEKIVEKQKLVENETALVRGGSKHNNHNIVDENANLMKLKSTKVVRPSYNKIISQRYFCEDCAGCKANVKGKCTEAKRKQICIDWQLEGYKKTMREKLNSREGKQKYLERMYDVEPVFGNIKHNQKMENFLCRGKPIVKLEFGLTCIAHNFVKIANWIKIDENRKRFDSLMRPRVLA